MKYLIIIILLFNININGQNCKLIKDNKSGKTMLVGITQREAFQDTSFAWWFNSEYMNYDVDTNTIAEAAEKFSDKNIKIVMGTWCSDSRREVPRVLKILDFINFPEDSLTIINVDRNKKGNGNEVENLDIELVPTIIIYKNDMEIGRIIETPQETLEKDLIIIVE